ncbi:MAG: zinc dependent phospholipase C family protein [Ruminococcus sp.]|nr:zinc dependent phospholipase C family protein [Ruminococcus sp.]
MNKLITIAAAAAAAMITVKILNPIRAYAWGGSSHDVITGFALDSFENQKKTQMIAFYKRYRRQLCEGSKAPDLEGDVDKGSGLHYYSSLDLKGKPLPQKGGYFRNRHGKYFKSARTCLEDNYTSALNLYKSGRTEEAMFVLGRAAHFVEDIACPPHSTSQPYAEKNDNMHYMFEQYADKTSKKYPPVGFDKRHINSYSDYSFENPANRLSNASGKFAPQIASLDESAFDKAQKALVPLAAENVMALLMKFHGDCHEENGNYIKDGSTVSLRCEGSGMMLTYTTKGGVALAKLDHAKEQRFTVVMNDNGSFALRAADGNFLSADLKKFVKPAEDGKGSAIRAAAVGRSIFRLSVGENFTKVMTGSRSSASAEDFAPGSSAQCWIITSV